MSEEEAKGLEQQLIELHKDCGQLLPKIKEIRQKLTHKEASKVIEAPLHLSFLLEKFEELVETRLLPTLSEEPHRQEQQPQQEPEERLPQVELDNYRREIPRYNLRLPIKYKVAPRDNEMRKAYSRDVGTMGLFIMSTHLEKTGAKVEIAIQLPDAEPMTIQGKVVWTKWVPPSLRTIDYPGFAVKVLNAPNAWYAYFMANEEVTTSVPEFDLT